MVRTLHNTKIEEYKEEIAEIWTITQAIPQTATEATKAVVKTIIQVADTEEGNARRKAAGNTGHNAPQLK